MPKPCGHTTDAGGCRVCHLYATRADYRALWDGSPPVAPVRLPCVHEGAVLEFASCGCEAKHVRDCDRHGRCVRDARHSRVPVCSRCEDYRVFAEIENRHLLYHVYPRKGSPWRTALTRLRADIGLFNGKRIVAVAVDATTEHHVMVQDALSGLGVEFVVLRNDPELREVASHPHLFGRLADCAGPNDTTLYAHAKGVTRPESSNAVRWGDVLAEVCFDWPGVRRALDTHAVAGPFKLHGRAWAESGSTWHYSGSWFWFRNAELFRRDWSRVDRFWSGIESYPSLHFSSDEAACLFHSGTTAGANLYDQGYWDGFVEPALTEWRAGRRPAPASDGLNYGCGPHYADGWHNVDVQQTATVRPDEVVPPGPLLPWSEGQFGRAYLGHVLEHLPWEGVVPLLREVRRVLRPGGRVLAVGPDWRRALERGDMQQAIACGEECGVENQHDPRRHWWACHEARLLAAVRAAGFAAEPLPPTPDALAGWPVVDFTAPQCAVLGVS